ncbi:uncharacterized protein METZ01_LOCUS230128, partial [marine metagenome]
LPDLISEILVLRSDNVGIELLSSIFLTNDSLSIVRELPKTFEGMHSITSPLLTESSMFEESDMYTRFFLPSTPIAEVLSFSFLLIVAIRTI